MVDILYLKFSQNEDIKSLLISIGNAIIVVVYPYDDIWGIGLNAKKIKFEDWSGKSLMKVREKFKV